MGYHTILGASGTISRELIPVLQSNNRQIRLVSRDPKPVTGAEVFQADMLNREQVFQAVKDSDVVYLLIGLEYNRKIWKANWPVIIQHTIDACKSAGARLIFFDNVYMYGKVNGPMTESTPFRPTSVKGFIRAELDEMLIREMNAGSLKTIIAKAADFYGPRATKTSVVGILVFDKMKKGKTSQWLSNAGQPHSYTYTPDAAKALYMLAMDESAYGQTWHLPTAKPALTGREFVALAAKYMKVSDKVRVLPSWLVRFIGWFDPIMKELGEMLYQTEYPYIFDSSKFEKAYPFKPTGYEEGIRQTAEWWLNS